ncbi:MAG: hypothetical protein GVY15_04435 [Bacteroidetes bacterium]|nr:hypothetical protein [Bacteroidota bacterium]
MAMLSFARSPFLLTGSLVCALLLLAMPVRAQTADEVVRLSQRTPGIGAANLGMGGVGIAGMADASAFITNPAGLGWLRRSEVSGSLTGTIAETDAVFGPSGDLTAETGTQYTIGNAAYLYNSPTQRGTFVIGAALNETHTFQRSTRFNGINDQSTITTSFLPFDGEFEIDGDEIRFFADLPDLAFGAGAIEFFDDLFEDGAFPFLQAAVPGTTLEQSGAVVEEGATREFNIGGAWEAAPRLMVGLSGNVSFANYRFENRFTEFDINGENTREDFNVLLDDGSLLEGFNAVTYDRVLDTQLVGFSARAGVSAQVNPLLRLGATLESPTFYSVEDDFRQSLQVDFEVGGSLSDELTSAFDYEIRTPWRFGAGAGLELGSVTAHADVEVVDWSQTEVSASGSQAFIDELNRQLRDDFSAVVNTRAGLELRLLPLTVRGGVAFLPDPAGNDAQDRTFLSAGVGYEVPGQFAVDFGWMQERFDDQLLPYPEDEVGPRQDDVIRVDEDVIRNRLKLGLRIFI